MLDIILNFLKDFDIHNITVMCLISWFIVKYFRNEVREEVKYIREEIQSIKEQTAAQSARSDRLYEMFIDLLKEKK